jgi:chromosome partitioning protein
MHIIAIAQQKGGVMKSTLAIHIAAEAQRKGRRAVILEMDTQGTVSLWSANRGAIVDAHDLLKGADNNKLPPEAIQIEATKLSQTLALLSNNGVAVALLDLPGSHNTAVNQAVRAADFVLLPARAFDADIAASADPLAVVQRLRKPYAYVMTFVEATSGKRADDAQEALEAEGHRVCPQFICRRQIYAEAVSEGLTVMEKEPSGKAADEIKNLWKWLSKQLGAKAAGAVESRDEQAAQASR